MSVRECKNAVFSLLLHPRAWGRRGSTSTHWTCEKATRGSCRPLSFQTVRLKHREAKSPMQGHAGKGGKKCPVHRTPGCSRGLDSLPPTNRNLSTGTRGEQRHTAAAAQPSGQLLRAGEGRTSHRSLNPENSNHSRTGQHSHGAAGYARGPSAGAWGSERDGDRQVLSPRPGGLCYGKSHHPSLPTWPRPWRRGVTPEAPLVIRPTGTGAQARQGTGRLRDGGDQ